MSHTTLNSFDAPDTVERFEHGRFEIINLGGVTIGRATYAPGWKWSTHVGPVAGTDLCEVEHVGLVVAGKAAVAYADGEITELTPGTLFHIPAEPHDSWVIGDETYVSLHFIGAENYARRS